jgi:hypothetical protein
MTAYTYQGGAKAPPFSRSMIERLKKDPEYIARAGRAAYVVDFAASGLEDYERNSTRVHHEDPKANCWSSSSRLLPDMHLPVFDVDVLRAEAESKVNLHIGVLCGSPRFDINTHIRWVPSTTEGHHHVYVEWAVEWDPYLAALKVLANEGVVEHGYARAAEARGQTFVRMPHVKRPPRPTTVEMKVVPAVAPDDGYF